MMQDFYSKIQSLHEEFQKCEKRYLDSERKWNSSSKWKKDVKKLQEYLQRVEQKEKGADETHRNIMNQMNGLTTHTDLLLSQLENLHNSLSHNAVYTPSVGLETNLSSYNTTESQIPMSTIPHFSLETLVKSSSSKCAATQTENVYSEKCSTSKPHSDLETFPVRESLLSTDKHSLFNVTVTPEKLSPPKVLISRTSQNDLDSLLTENSNFQPVLSSGKNFTFQETPKNYIKNNSQKQVIISSQNTDDDLSLNVGRKDTQSLLRNEVMSLSISADSGQENVSRGKNVPLESQTLEHDSIESKVEDYEIDVEAVTSKSDAESVNNEFDFLESDTIKTVSKKKTPKNFVPPFDKRSINTDKVDDTEDEQKTVLKHKHFTKPVIPSAKTFGDDKSETSGSVSGPPSPTISLASDSESIHDKGSPSTAYQMLLRNTVIPRNANSDILESDSEDEVEKELASSAQRRNLEQKIPASAQNDEPVSKPESQPSTKESKAPFQKNPQSKLSKTTRKVLGLDSSSGSEIELAVKPPKRNDEGDDDDEFDSFFN